jgi:hypothetical protein
MMNTHHLKEIAVGAIVSGGLALAGLGLTAGAAHADPYWFHWCPGQEHPSGTADRNVDWDWNVCHAYYYQSDGNGNHPADLIDETGRVYSAAPVARPDYCPPWNVVIGPSACGGL